VGEVGKIGGENGWGDDDVLHKTQRSTFNAQRSTLNSGNRMRLTPRRAVSMLPRFSRLESRLFENAS
jgi:hypothetical protein